MSVTRISRKEIRNRLRESALRRETYFRERWDLRVKFNKNFDQFVANVAQGLSRPLKYRSDQGQFARGLVADSDPKESLRQIHETMFRAWDMGQVVRLIATLYRRQVPLPMDRWVMYIEFGVPQSEANFEPDVLPRSDPKRKANKIIGEATAISKKISGDRGKRIRAYLDLAGKYGYPGMLQLWHYNPVAVREFAISSEAEQTKMINKGGGFPLSGELSGTWQGGPPNWRIFPFRELFDKHFSTPMDANSLGAIDEMIAKSVLMLSEGPGGKGAGGESVVSGKVIEFRKELIRLGRDPNSLYYASDKNTEDHRGLFD